MARKKIWLGKFRTMKVKVYDETFDRYKGYLAMKKKTIQQDIEEYIINQINEKKTKN